jgi:hypothetical protein
MNGPTFRTYRVRATEAVSQQEFAIHRAKKAQLSQIYTPLIVTTAKLFVCDLASEKIDPASGEIPDGDFEPVPFVRFQKSLSAPGQFERYRDLGDVGKQAERIVLVVQAGSLMEVLRKLDVDRTAPVVQQLWASKSS